MSIKSINSENLNIPVIDNQRVKIFKLLVISTVASAALGISAFTLTYFIPMKVLLQRFNFSCATYKIIQIALSGILGLTTFSGSLIVGGKIIKKKVNKTIQIEEKLKQLQDKAKDLQMDYKNILIYLQELKELFRDQNEEIVEEEVENKMEKIEKKILEHKCKRYSVRDFNKNSCDEIQSNDHLLKEELISCFEEIQDIMNKLK